MHIKSLIIGGLAVLATVSQVSLAAAEPREVRIASHVSALSPLHQQSQMDTSKNSNLLAA